VVKAIVKLARALNLSIIAEGVETQGQRDILTSVGCSRVQGYIYSPAVTPVAIDGMIGGKMVQAA
jgi:EAL domain-containing protein (putative c-di-GMP-specific phosphodiesterase class I)